MIRFLLIVLVLFLYLLLGIPVLLFEAVLGHFNPKARDYQCLRLVQATFRFMLFIAGTRITVIGEEKIPDEPVLFIGNHRSYFDILVGYTTVPGLMGFVAKKEMLRYPFLRSWMKNVNCLFLDRENIKEGLKTILEGIDHVKNGISVWIFPEGTRNRNEDLRELLPFKEGSLKIAEKTGCPVVPVAIMGTADVFEKHMPFIRPAKVTVYYGTPFYIKDLDPADRKKAGAYTREVIRDMLLSLQEEKEWT